MEKQPASRDAFEAALAAGHLSHDTTAPNYVGHYMFMGRESGVDYFKHRDTRKYHNRQVPIDITELRDELRNEIAARGDC